MSPAWERKTTVRPRQAPMDPLVGRALERMRTMPTATLIEWIDNSLAKIGKLVADSQREGMAALLPDAQREAQALVQALGELAARG